MHSNLQLNPSNRTLRQFAGTWFLVFLGAAVHHFIHGHKGIAAALIGIGLVGVLGLINPRVVKYLFIFATIVAFPVGWITTQSIIAIMFYLVLTPIALICRWRGRDLLQLRRQAPKSSLWMARTEARPPESYLKEF